MSCLLQILEKEMESPFEQLWTSIVAVKPKSSKPFWSLNDLFKCFEKHWIAVFGMIKDVKASDKKLFDQLRATFSRRSAPNKDRRSAAAVAAKFLGCFRRRPYGQAIHSAIVQLLVR